MILVISPVIKSVNTAWSDILPDHSNFNLDLLFSNLMFIDGASD